MAVSKGGKWHDASVQPRIADLKNARDFGAAFRAGDLDGIDPGPVRGVALEFVPPLDGPLVEFILTAHDVEMTAVLALEYG